MMKRKRLTALIVSAVVIYSAFMGVYAAPTAKNSDNAPTGTSQQATSQPQTENTQSENTLSENQNTEADANSQNSGGETQASVGTGGGTEYIEDDALTPPDVQYAEAALLMDMNSGRLLYGKNIDEKLYPASITKIMTGIIALETGNLEDVVTASYEAIKPITLEDSHMGIYTGEELTMEQLITGMLVHSANDAANVIAVYLSGSMDAFVDVMNSKAAELGMTSTHFENPCGIHGDNHYTTARDMAILSQYAMKNEKFREIVKMPIYKIAPTNKYKTERILVNTNLFLGTSRSVQHYYPPCNGIKTGHTSQSGYCLVSSAKYNDTELLAIVMKCPNENDNEKAYSYIDSRTLFDFGFDNYVSQIVATPGDIVSDKKVKEARNDTRVALTVETDVNALVPANVDRAAEIISNINIPDVLYAPIKKGDVLGNVTYTYKGTQIGTANLIATNDVERNEFLHILNLIIKIISSPFFFIPVVILVLVIMFAAAKKKKRERRRRINQLKNQKRATPNRNASRAERLGEETKSENSRYSNHE